MSTRSVTLGVLAVVAIVVATQRRWQLASLEVPTMAHPHHSNTPPSDFTVTAMGLVFATACTTLSNDEATNRLNLRHRPTSVGGAWEISPTTFDDGKSNPHPCDRWPDPERRHILFAVDPSAPVALPQVAPLPCEATT